MARVSGDDHADFGELCAAQSGVLTLGSAVQHLGDSAVRWRLTSGRWRRAGAGVLVTNRDR